MDWQIWSTASTSLRPASSDAVAHLRSADQLRRPRQARQRAARRRSAPGDDQRRKRRRGGAGAGASPAQLGRSAEAGGAGQSAVRAQGRGHEDGRAPSPFGVDHDRVPALVRGIIAAGAEWRGLHIFAGSQALDADALIEAAARDRRARRRRSPKRPAHAPADVNLGGGFGIPYFHGEQPLDVEAVGAALGETLADAPPILARHRFRDRARPLAGRRGGRLSDPDRRPQGEPRQDLPGHRRRPAPPCSPPAAISASSLRRNYPVAIASRFGAEPEEEVTHRRLPVHAARPARRRGRCCRAPRSGDLVAIFCAGAYGLSASPQAFLSQPRGEGRSLGLGIDRLDEIQAVGRRVEAERGAVPRLQRACRCRPAAIARGRPAPGSRPSSAPGDGGSCAPRRGCGSPRRPRSTSSRRAS